MYMYVYVPIDDWVPLLQDFDGLLQLAAHECVGELKPNEEMQCPELLD